MPQLQAVAPFVGAWIEMPAMPCPYKMALVAPFVGAWIEIDWTQNIKKLRTVAPFVGAWIEIHRTQAMPLSLPSLRSSERGLKWKWQNLRHDYAWSLRSSERGLKFHIIGS